MSEALIPTRDCNVLAINIPSITAALSIMSSEIINATLLLPKIRDASMSLEEIIRNSHYVDLSAHHEATALKQSAHNLGQTLELAISQFQKRMASLQEVLSKKSAIPTSLSTADDVSVAFHIAVNRPNIDWHLAEVVLDRFSILCTKELTIDRSFCQTVWNINNFENNMVKLLKGGDCWRLKKSLKLIQNIVVSAHDLTVSASFFDSLASVIWDLRFPADVEEERKWAYLIAKNQDTLTDRYFTDRYFPRMINSFLYSQKGKSSTTYNVLKIISALIGNEHGPRVNDNSVSKSQYVPSVLYRCLHTEKDNSDVINVCLDLALIMVRTVTIIDDESDVEEEPHDEPSFLCDLCEKYSFCPQLIVILDKYISDEEIVKKVLKVIHLIIFHRKNIARLTITDLIGTLVSVFQSPYHHNNLSSLVDVVEQLIFHDRRRFHELGIPQGSNFFGVFSHIQF
jgi:hypothetical protein